MLTPGQRLRKLREESKISQRRLSELTGYSNAYISRCESDDRTPSWSFLIAVSEHLDSTALYLRTGSHSECPVCLRG